MYRHDTRRSRLLQLSRTCHLLVKLHIRQTRKSRHSRVMAVPAVTSEMQWWLLPREVEYVHIKSTIEHHQLDHFLGIEFRSSYSMGCLLCLCERHQRTPHYEAHQAMQAKLHTGILAALDHSHGAATRTLRPALAAHDRLLAIPPPPPPPLQVRLQCWPSRRWQRWQRSKIGNMTEQA